MKKLTILIVIQHLILGIPLLAQNSGEWVWMNGVNIQNYSGVYGTLGVLDPSNKPPGVYEAVEWTDKQGNFWFYGGNSPGKFLNDMWKYDVSLNQWVWIKGSGGLSNQLPVYGTLGVASPLNSPGERVTSSSWVDNNGDLWLFGGIGYYAPNAGCPYNDLWKYSISNNVWTCMRGDTVRCSTSGHYGIKGIEVNTNIPYQQDEMGITWADKNDNLWMLDANGCLWKYRITTNNWIWMKGDTTGVPSYGQKGQASINTTPGASLMAYTRWKDSNDDLWYLYNGHGSYSNILFKYNIDINMWSWVWGDTLPKFLNDDCRYGDSTCNYTFNTNNSENVIPFSRLESRTCWTDNCNNLWMLGGYGMDHSTSGNFNDFVYFDPSITRWIWVGNDTTHNYFYYYGTMGVSDPSNKPAARSGAIPFKDTAGNLWLFGGIVNSVWSSYGDLWKFNMDNGCPPCVNPHGFVHVGIDDISYNKTKITISPNPFSHTCKIESNYFLKDATIQLLTMYGQKVLELKKLTGNSLTIDRGNMEGGIYFLKLMIGNIMISINKIVID